MEPRAADLRSLQTGMWALTNPTQPRIWMWRETSTHRAPSLEAASMWAAAASSTAASPPARDTTGAGVSVGGPLSTSGGLTINGDTTMHAAPRMYFTGFFAGNLGTPGQTSTILHLDKGIVITRMMALSQPDTICSPTGGISVVTYDGGPGYTVFLTENGAAPYSSDSGDISVPVPARSVLILIVSQLPACGLAQGPNNVSVSVEYVMQ